MPAAAGSRSKAGGRSPISTSPISPGEFEDAGAAAIIYTDIERDGVSAGLNVEATVALADAVTCR